MPGTTVAVVARGPPPLVSVPSQTGSANPSTSLSVVEQGNVNPFYIKPLAGNIRICQGCRGSLRLPDDTVPAPPFDFVVARVEKKCFRDSTGVLRTPSRPSAAHYHLRLACIRAVEPSFIPSTLNIPQDVTCLFSAQHCHHLQLEFGLQFIH